MGLLLNIHLIHAIFCGLFLLFIEAWIPCILRKINTSLQCCLKTYGTPWTFKPQGVGGGRSVVHSKYLQFQNFLS
uniref:Uncharacterized protein n=1 Tax=Anguilla anguilla TaxID=7936 RepID=A0A0E9WYK6_ANGAN